MNDNPVRLLIVDDSPEDREAYRRRLSKGGQDRYIVAQAETGEEGLQLCRTQLPACLLLDYNLPDMNGLEFLGRLRAEHGQTAVAVVMLTGQGNETIAVEAMKAGAQDYLVKGLGAEDVRRAVRGALENVAFRRQIEEQRRRLEASEQALLEASRRKDEFLAMLAHELRNPLAPIRNSLNILRMSGGMAPGTEMVQEIMERQVGHMVRLVDDLLEISRISRGVVELRFELIDLATVVRSAVETSRPLIDGARHQFTVSLPPQPVLVEVDPVALLQVISNLLNNAARYTPEGGKITLSVEFAVEQDEVRISVRDNGIGIPPEMLQRVFDLFTQVDRSQVQSQSGLGIGLALVKSLVEMHGGRVEASSQGKNTGSEFTVRLPFSKRRTCFAGNSLSGSGNGSAPAPPTRVLVVDDNRDAADTLSMVLKFMGSDVFATYDGESALKAIRDYKPAMVLLDLGMPGMDGYEVARRLRTQAEVNPILVALTGWGQEEDRRRSKVAGFDHHLVKPIDLAALQKLFADLPTELTRDLQVS